MPSDVTWSFTPGRTAVYLTYSQVGDLSVSDVQAFFDSIGSDKHIVGHELHEDGGHHYHCLVHFGDVHRWNSSRVFDIEGRHPNVKMVRGVANIHRVLAYVTKDDDYYDCGNAYEHFASGSCGKRGRNDIWGEIIACETEATFWEKVKSLAPYEYATRYDALKGYCNAHYKMENTYVAPDVTWAPSATLDDMNSWVDQFLV